jgi:peptide/nickel transport system ATP-binding protein
VQPAFEASRLAVGFPGGVRALREVDLRVSAGEIVGIVGESGSGKSVLGLAALGLLPTDAVVSGRAGLAGTDMVAASPQRRRLARRTHAGAVFQDPMTSLNPTKRVGAQLLEVCASRERAMELLAEVNVPEPARRFGQFPHELSGGLRQRVMIAMAVARRPTLVVADEPTTALDVVVQAEIAGLFRRLRDELHVAFLFITHDLALAAQISDRVVVMYGGRIAEAGPTGEILGRPRHPYAAALLQTRLTLGVDTTVPLPTLPGEPPDPRRLRDECPFVPRCRFAREQCRAGLPALAQVAGPAHAVACCRAAEIDALAITSTPAPGTADAADAPATPGGTGGTAAGDHALAAVVRERGSRRARPRTARPGTVPAGADHGPQAGGGQPAAVLVVQNLAKAFGAHQAVRDVSFSIGAGQALALAGESGCGKTTTLRIVVGLERQDRGHADVAPGPRPQMIFQDVGASLTPWMTVGQLLAERLRAERVPREQWPRRIDAVLALTGLAPDMRDRRPGRLSGGQRQRVALARAVIVTPPLLVCDEPTSALDVSLASTALNLLNALRRDLGMAVLIVTHDLAVARATAEHIAVMQDGEIVERGEIGQVLTSPATGYTRRLLGAVPTIGGPDGVR